jgi:hypothetical protein
MFCFSTNENKNRHGDFNSFIFDFILSFDIFWFFFGIAKELSIITSGLTVFKRKESITDFFSTSSFFFFLSSSTFLIVFITLVEGIFFCLVPTSTKSVFYPISMWETNKMFRTLFFSNHFKKTWVGNQKNKWNERAIKQSYN